MSDDGWLWTLPTIGALVPAALTGTPPTEIPEDGYDHPDYDPEEYFDRSERARVRWEDGSRGEAALTVSKSDGSLTEGSFQSDRDLYDYDETSVVRMVPAERRAVFGEWAYLLVRTGDRQSWSLSGDRLHYQCRFPTGIAVPEDQLYDSAAKALALIEDPSAERVRPTLRLPSGDSDYEWRT